MEIRRLGATGFDVPVVGMGTWRTFDVTGAAAVANAHAVAARAFEAGARVFDSSPMYGHAETVLGEALRPLRRDVIVATKVWTPSPAEGRHQVDRALALFGGRIDLYQLHNLVAWRDHLKTLLALKDSGQVGAVGATHYSPQGFAELKTVMKTGQITAVQVPYNPLESEVTAEILPLAADLGLGVVVMRPFGQGRLVTAAPSASALEPLHPFGVRTWAQALLKWVLSDTRCHVAIPATSRPERMTENAAAGEAPWFGASERAYVSKLAKAL